MKLIPKIVVQPVYETHNIIKIKNNVKPIKIESMKTRK